MLVASHWKGLNPFAGAPLSANRARTDIELPGSNNSEAYIRFWVLRMWGPKMDYMAPRRADFRRKRKIARAAKTNLLGKVAL